jgi:hypothetical protein
MMGKYLSAAETAYALIARKGGDVPLVRRVETAFDPITQSAGVSEETYTFKGVCMPPSAAAKYRVGTLEGLDARECYLSSKEAVTPAVGDVITWEGASWRIFWAQTYNPAGDGAIFTLAYAQRG